MMPQVLYPRRTGPDGARTLFDEWMLDIERDREFVVVDDAAPPTGTDGRNDLAPPLSATSHSY